MVVTAAEERMPESSRLRLHSRLAIEQRRRSTFHRTRFSRVAHSSLWTPSAESRGMMSVTAFVASVLFVSPVGASAHVGFNESFSESAMINRDRNHQGGDELIPFIACEESQVFESALRVEFGLKATSYFLCLLFCWLYTRCGHTALHQNLRHRYTTKIARATEYSKRRRINPKHKPTSISYFPCLWLAHQEGICGECKLSGRRFDDLMPHVRTNGVFVFDLAELSFSPDPPDPPDSSHSLNTFSYYYRDDIALL